MKDKHVVAAMCFGAAWSHFCSAGVIAANPSLHTDPALYQAIVATLWIVLAAGILCHHQKQ